MNTCLKVCQNCGEYQPLDSFHKNRTEPDGFCRRCKVCESLRAKKSETIYDKFKRAANKDGKWIDLTFEQWMQLRSAKTCACCKVQFDQSVKQMQVSIDRLDSEIGYTVENCRSICWGCNNLKGANTVETLKMILRYMEEK